MVTWIISWIFTKMTKTMDSWTDGIYRVGGLKDFFCNLDHFLPFFYNQGPKKKRHLLYIFTNDIIIKYRFNYHFGPQSIPLCQFGHQCFIFMSFWSSSLKWWMINADMINIFIKIIINIDMPYQLIKLLLLFFPHSPNSPHTSRFTIFHHNDQHKPHKHHFPSQ